MGIGSARNAAVIAIAAFALLACAGSNAKSSGSPNCAADVVDAANVRAESIPVLANDSAPGGGLLSLTSVSAPAHGTATIDPGGAVSYTAAPGYTGPDAFTYRASDGHGGACTGTVTIVVHAIANTTLHASSRGYPLDPVATADAAGGMWVVWPEVLPEGIALRALRTAADVYTPLDSVFVSTISGPTGAGFAGPSVRAVSDGVGGIVVAWIDHLKTPPDHALFAQRIEISRAARWNPGGRPVCGQQDRNPTYDAVNHFDLLADGYGGAFVAWVAGTDPDTTIAVQHLAGDDGMLDLDICGTTVSGSQTMAVEPHLVPDGTSGVVVAWTRFGGGPSAQRLGPGGLAWGPDPVLVASAGFNASVAPDGAGGALMAFAFGPGYGDLRVQRVGVAGDLPWGSEGVDLVTAAGIQEFPRIVADGAGGAVVAWWDHRGHAYSYYPPPLDAPATYAQRVHADGTVAWARDGVLVCSTPVPRMDPGPVLVADGAGGAIAVWMDQRDGTADANLFAQRLLAANGAAAWPANGIHVTDAPGPQTFPAALPDDAGGAAIFFKDGRSAAARRLSGQRLLPDGSLP